MNALLGRANYGNVTGDILVNDTPGGLSALPSLVGFVPQDDVVHANLTVYENLYYNAVLRLPAASSTEAKLKHVVNTLEVLGIMHIRDSLVGDARRRGVSGGQKKRVNSAPPALCPRTRGVSRTTLRARPLSHGASCMPLHAYPGSAHPLHAWRPHAYLLPSRAPPTCARRSSSPAAGRASTAGAVGMELAAMPAIIFMDEPTSGLDGAATVQLAQCLSGLCNSGLTIICVIHQPRYSVFAAFSHVLLLGAGGRQVRGDDLPLAYRLPSPRLASPRLASPRLASPRLATPRLATPRLASPWLIASALPSSSPSDRSSAAAPAIWSATCSRTASGCPRRRTSPTG